MAVWIIFLGSVYEFSLIVGNRYVDSCSSENSVRECGVFAVFIYFFFHMLPRIGEKGNISTLLE